MYNTYKIEIQIDTKDKTNVEISIFKNNNDISFSEIKLKDQKYIVNILYTIVQFLNSNKHDIINN